MPTNHAITSIALSILAVLAGWALLSICAYVFKKICQYRQITELRRQGKTVPTSRMHTEPGVVLIVGTRNGQFDNCIEFWWIPTYCSSSDVDVVEKWIAGEAFAFEKQAEIKHMFRANSIPTQFVQFNEVSRHCDI